MPNFLHSHYRWVVVGFLWLVHAFGFMNFSSLGILAGIIFPFFVLYFSWRQSLFTVGLVEMACAVFIYKLAKESPVKTPVPKSSLAWRKIFHIALHRDMLILGEAMGKEFIGLATGPGYFFGFLGSPLCPPFFGYLIDRTGVYGYAWLFLTCCAGTILFLLSLFAEANSKERVKNDL